MLFLCCSRQPEDQRALGVTCHTFHLVHGRWKVWVGPLLRAPRARCSAHVSVGREAESACKSSAGGLRDVTTGHVRLRSFPTVQVLYVAQVYVGTLNTRHARRLECQAVYRRLRRSICVSVFTCLKNVLKEYLTKKATPHHQGSSQTRKHKTTFKTHDACTLSNRIYFHGKTLLSLSRTRHHSGCKAR